MNEVAQLWRNAVNCGNNAIRTALIERLNERSGSDDSSGTRTESFTAFAKYLNSEIKPTAFVTIPLLYTASESVRARRNVRAAEFYLRMWTSRAERKLWGASAARVRVEDGCLYFFVRETAQQDCWTQDGRRRQFTHFHGACRMPSRPMRAEHKCGTLPVGQRCALLQEALTNASKKTTEPYRSEPTAHLKGADVNVIPYRADHATYMFKQFRPAFREHWTEMPDPKLMTDHGVFIL